MTNEQIDLEFAHMGIDKKLKAKANGTETYEDAEYDNYDKETDSKDSRLSDMPVFGSEIDPNHVAKANDQKESDWDDVEIDDED